MARRHFVKAIRSEHSRRYDHPLRTFFYAEIPPAGYPTHKQRQEQAHSGQAPFEPYSGYRLNPWRCSACITQPAACHGSVVEPYTPADSRHAALPRPECCAMCGCNF